MSESQYLPSMKPVYANEVFHMAFGANDITRSFAHELSLRSSTVTCPFFAAVSASGIKVGRGPAPRLPTVAADILHPFILPWGQLQYA